MRTPMERLVEHWRQSERRPLWRLNKSNSFGVSERVRSHNGSQIATCANEIINLSKLKQTKLKLLVNYFH